MLMKFYTYEYGGGGGRLQNVSVLEKGGGGANFFYPYLRGGGGTVSDPRFSHFVAAHPRNL